MNDLIQRLLEMYASVSDWVNILWHEMSFILIVCGFVVVCIIIVGAVYNLPEFIGYVIGGILRGIVAIVKFVIKRILSVIKTMATWSLFILIPEWRVILSIMSWACGWIAFSTFHKAWVGFSLIWLSIYQAASAILAARFCNTSWHTILSILNWICAWMAFYYLYEPWVVWVFVCLGIYQAWKALHGFINNPYIVRLKGFNWTVNDFCRGWLITGMTGSGKTTAAINRLLWQVSKNCRNWGGVCIDEKGLFWETLTPLFKKLDRKYDLILLKVRPDSADNNWQPEHRFNFLDIPGIPFSAHAKTICDVADALGQRGGNTFFKTQAQIHIEWAFKALQESGYLVSLDECYRFLTNERTMYNILEVLKRKSGKHALSIVEHFNHNFSNQPPEQLGGVRQTISNYLKYFTDPAIAEVFCPKQSTFSFEDIDKGKVICLSIPQKYAVERRYLNTLLKMTFYRHAIRRFDKPSSKRARDNLIILWADEAQKIVTASEDGLSDYNAVDVIREAKATVVAATQSFLSLVPPMGSEDKAKVFIANMGNRIIFKAADEESAKIAADTLGKREVPKYTYSVSKDKHSKDRYSESFSLEQKYWIEPHHFRKLRKFEAVIYHCEGHWRRLKLKPIRADGKALRWH